MYPRVGVRWGLGVLRARRQLYGTICGMVRASSQCLTEASPEFGVLRLGVAGRIRIETAAKHHSSPTCSAAAKH